MTRTCVLEDAYAPLLEARISPEVVAQLYAFLKSRKSEDGLRNVRLLSPSLRQDFQNGSVRILRSPAFGPIDFSAEDRKPKDKWTVDITVPALTQVNNVSTDGHGQIIFRPTTPDNARLPLPNASLLPIHSAVLLPLHFLVIEGQIRRGWPPVRKAHSEAQLMTTALKTNNVDLLAPRWTLQTILRSSLKTNATSTLYKPHYQVFFTHSDLHQTNIFVEAGRLSGIIDWEYAGFKPEYWEYTRGLLSYWGRGEHKVILDHAFEGEYEEELAAQRYLWKAKPIF
ncbi:hypothetical protein AJ79_03709 [Helicocarpus griseus UAMH5409]|uniref:Aminoglycoside phosphotransferase domain-containing protein n=1 Tax=Helicocarpus griseus UAMH5409 TaxID=1447875 RepID=A0A2B7XWQ0_9EURO|nr:hypothetical protein AJ79_03709 [Helicocarpus griseus UAMH5409]